MAPRHIRNVYGIFKAYCTRVGSGPSPPSYTDEVGAEMAKRGQQFGSVTGSLGAVAGWTQALRYTTMLSGVTHLILMKSDADTLTR